MKSQDLSINFLVKFILAITMFGLGVALVWQIFFDSTETANISQGEFEKRIAALNCRPNEVVCISSTAFDVKAGESVLLDMKISNVFSDDLTFVSTIKILNSTGTEIFGQGIVSELIEVLPKIYPSEGIKAKNEKNLPFLIKTTKSLPKGMYVAHIEVTYGSLEDPQTEIKRIQFSVN